MAPFVTRKVRWKFTRLMSVCCSSRVMRSVGGWFQLAHFVTRKAMVYPAHENIWGFFWSLGDTHHVREECETLATPKRDFPSQARPLSDSVPLFRVTQILSCCLLRWRASSSRMGTCRALRHAPAESTGPTCHPSCKFFNWGQSTLFRGSEPTRGPLTCQTIA